MHHSAFVLLSNHFLFQNDDAKKTAKTEKKSLETTGMES